MNIDGVELTLTPEMLALLDNSKALAESLVSHIKTNHSEVSAHALIFALTNILEETVKLHPFERQPGLFRNVSKRLEVHAQAAEVRIRQGGLGLQ